MKKLIIFSLFWAWFFALALPLHAQVQLGADIDGEAAGDRSGGAVAISADGTKLAVGAFANNGNGSGSGHVRVFQWIGSAWVQQGADIDGEAAGDLSGHSLALSANGTKLAIGAPGNDATADGAGHVRVFQWTGSAWVQQGADINGEAQFDQLGTSVALSSDGTKLVIGAPWNAANGFYSGHVRVYQWNGSAWIKQGADIDGAVAYDELGRTVAISADGTKLAAGAPGSNGYRGQVRVYQWSGSAWVQQGANINGAAANDGLGNSVSLSADGTKLAIGVHGSNAYRGQVRVYQWSGSAWVQLGTDLDGEAVSDKFGSAVALSSDGTRLVAGAYSNDGNGLHAGHVRIFQWSGTAWTQLGTDIDGEAAGDNSGDAVSFSADGTRVAIGATANDGINGANSGHVRVYQVNTTCLQVATATQGMTWTGAVSTDWNNACNWSPNGIPGPGNYVTIASGANNPILSTTATVISVQMNNSKKLTVSPTGRLNIVGDGGNVSGINFYESSSVQNDGSIYIEALNGSTLTYTDIFYGGTANGCSLINNGFIRINSNAFVIGLRAGNTITNNSCGKIIMLGGGTFDNPGLVTNYGLIETANNISQSGTFTNNGVLKYNAVTGNAVINNQNSSVIVKNTPTPIFTYGGTFNGTINGIFTDAAATTSAGTFTAPNTFVPSGLPSGSQTLYAKITPSGGACTYIVPFTYTPPTLSAGNITNPTTCSGTGSTGSIAFTTTNVANGTYPLSFTTTGTSSPQNVMVTNNAFTLSGLTAGAYSNFSLNVFGSTATDNTPKTVANPAAPTLTAGLVTNNATCGGNAGTIAFTTTNLPDGFNTLRFTVSPSTTPSSKTIVVSGNTFNLTGLKAGTYSNFSVTNPVTGCVGTTNVSKVVTEPAQTTITAGAVTNSDFCGGVNGKIAFTSTNVPDGTYQMTYTASTGATAGPKNATVSGNTVTLGGLKAGTYSNFSISPFNCPASDATSKTVADPSVPTLTAGFVTSPTTCSGTNGKIAFTSTNLPNGTYQLSFTATGATASPKFVEVSGNAFDLKGLTAGTYSNFLVTKTGCTGTDATSKTVSDPASPTITAGTTVQPTTCGGTGSIPFTTTNLADGTYALEFTETGATATTSPQNVTVLNNAFTLSNLGLGNYTDFSLTRTGCTATSSASKTIANPATPTLAAGVKVNPTTCGSANGSIPFTTNVPNGTYQLTYTGAGSPQTVTVSSGAFTLSGLAAGGYSNFSITNNGCTKTIVAARSLSDPNPPVLTLGTTSNPTACNLSDGSIAFTSTNITTSGTYSLSYSKDGVSTAKNVTVNSSGAFTLTGLADGVYDGFSITNLSGCTGSLETDVTLNDLALPILTVGTSSNPSTCGGTNGTIAFTSANLPNGNYSLDFTTTGTASPKNVMVSSGAFTLSGLAAGTYSNFSVTHLGCMGSVATSKTLSNPATPTITAGTAIDPSTCAGADGEIEFTSSNLPNGTHSLSFTPTGTGATTSPKNVIVSNNTFTLEGLTAGTYSAFSVTRNNCIGTSAAAKILSDPPSPTITAGVVTLPTTCSTADGSIAFTSTNLPNDDYTLNYKRASTSLSQTVTVVNNTFSLQGLDNGTYNSFSIEHLGCTAAHNVSKTVTNPAAPTLTAGMATNPTTCLSTDGKIAFTTALLDGTYNMTYTGSGSPKSVTVVSGAFELTGLADGTYSNFRIADSGCTSISSGTKILTDPALPTLTAGLATNPTTCFGDDGTIAFTTSLPNGIYTLNYTGFGSPQDIAVTSGAFTLSNLSSGTYDGFAVTIGGCTGIDNTMKTLNDPVTPTITGVNQTNILCNGSATGAITFSVTGASGGILAVVRDANNNPLTTTGSNPYTASGLAAGIYSIIVTQSGCSASQNVTLTQPSTPLSISTSKTNVTINGGNNGTITVTASGGTGSLQFSKDGGVNYTTGASPFDFNNLIAGDYQIRVKDANACETAISTVTITQPTAVNFTTSETNILCNGASTGSIQVNVTNGTSPFEFSKDDGATFEMGSNPFTFNDLAAATYKIKVKDNTGFVTSASSVTLTQPTALNISTSKTNVTINGGNNGTITVTASGGTGSLQFSKDGGVNYTTGTSPFDFNNLIAGDYQIRVKDANACESTVSAVTITQPTAVNFTTSETNIACNGASTGAIQVNVTNGTSPFEFSKDDGVTFVTGANPFTFNGLAAATYKIKVKDNTGFVTSASSVTLMQPTALNISTSKTNVTVNGGNNGTITVTASGGTGSLQFSKDGGVNYTTGTSPFDFNNLIAGDYQIRVKDANACETAVSTVTITQPTAVNFTTTETNVLCNGASTGSIQVNVTNGTSPYQFSKDDGATFVTGANPFTFNGLAAAIYKIKVKDNTGFITSATLVTLTQPTALNISTSKTNVTVNGGNNGTITVTASGGTGSLQFSKDGGVNYTTGTSPFDFNNLIAGDYQIRVKDANACETAVSTVTITQPTAVNFTTTETNVLCNGASTGSIQVNVTNGTSPYQFSKDDGATFVTGANPFTFNGLAATTYKIKVKDNTGFITSATLVTLTQPTALNISTSKTNVTVNGGNNGTITVTASGGTGSLQFSKDGGTTYVAGTSPYDFTTLIAGDYQIRVKDANACESTVSAVTITQPTAVNFTTSETNIACNGASTGAIQVNVTNGTSPFEFSKDDGVTFVTGANPFTFNDLAAATYKIKVKDNTGFVTSASLVTLTQPTALNISTSKTNVTVNGGNNGTITVTASGGTGSLQFSKDGGVTYVAGTSPFDFNNLIAGDYQIRVKDANACETAISTVTITQPTAVNFTTTKTNILCNGASTGAIQVTVSAGISPFEFSKDDGATFVMGANPFTFNDLAAATYKIKVKDNTGFVTSASSVTLTQPNLATATEDMTWTGTVSTDWNNPCNWTPNGIPTATNSIAIPNVANDPVIMSGTTADVFRIDIGNSASLTINSGAELNVLPTDVLFGISAIYFSSNATLTNNGTLNATSTVNVPLIALRNENTSFNNNGTANLNSPLRNILMNGTNAIVNNSASGIINFQGNRGLNCINGTTGNVITNQGTMNYTGYDYFAALNPGFTLNNSGTIDIKSGSGIAMQGGTLNNLACAKILMPARIYDNRSNGITTNAGLIIAGGLQNTNGIFTNNGVLKYSSLSGNAIINNQNSSVIVNNTPTPIFTYGGTYDGAINGIFTDATATTSAGTFTAPNTFVSDVTLPAGSQTLYAKITPNGGACSYIVPFTYLNCTASATINYAGSPFCNTLSNGAVTLTGTNGGTFSSTAGLNINATTGIINPSASISGSYVVNYNIPAANGCTAVNATANVTIMTTPTVYNVTGTGLYCNGSSGLAVGLSNSELGVDYQLKNGSSTIGTPQNGTNAAISFGNQGIGTYTVVATNTVGGCTATMAASAVISANLAPPTIAVKEITVNLNSAGTVSVTASQVDNGTTGFCTIATRQLSKTDFNCTNVGANIVTFTATDVNGNSASSTAKITVKDVSAPTVLVKDITVNLVNCAASITAAQVNNGSGDNCAITSMNVTPNTFAFANIGSNIVTFTATDATGNSASTTLTVTVNNVTGSISGYAWKDLDNNGIEGGTGEIGVTGLSVTLYNSDANGNKTGAAINNTTTGVNGIYTFSNVNKGDYVVEIDKTQISNMGMLLSRKLNAGGSDALDNDFIFASGLTEKIVLDPCDITKKNITAINAGITILGSIGDRFWKDSNNNGSQDNGEAGVAGINLELYVADANGNPTGAALKTSTTTAPNGDYRFEELDNGMYLVKVVLSSIAPTMELSKKKDLGGNDALDNDFDRFSGLSPKITIVPTDPTKKDILTMDGAIRNRTRGTIGDFVWKDLIENGIQENCEKGVPNLTMEIYMKNPQTSVLGKLDTISGVFTPNVPMFTTTTNSAGKYLFSNLEDETWVVKVVKSSILANMELSPLQNQGGNDASDSDFNTTTALSDEVSLDPYSSTLRHNVTIDAAIRNMPCDNLKAAAATFENTGNTATGALSVANTMVNISVATTNSQIVRTNQERAATIFGDNAYSTKPILGGYLVIKDKRDENGLVTLNFNTTVSNPILYFKDIVRRKLDLSSSVDVNGNPICMRKISGNANIQVDEMLMTLQNSDPAQAGSPTQSIHQGAVVVQLIGDFSSIKIQSSSLFAASDNWTMSIASEDYNCGSPLVTLPIIVKNRISNILPKDPNNPTGNMLVTFEVEINNPTAIQYNNLFVENYLDEKWGAALVGISEAPHIIFPHNSIIIQANPNYNGISDVNLLMPNRNNKMNGGDLIRIRYSIELNPTLLNSFTNKSIAKALSLRFENAILVGSTSQPIFLPNFNTFNIPVYLPSSIVLPTNPIEDIAGGTVPVYYSMWLQCFGKSMVTPDPQCGKVTWGFNRTPKLYTQNCGNTGIWHTAFLGIDECGNHYYFTADFTSIDKNPPVWDMKPMDKSIACNSATASQDLAMWLNSAGGAWYSDPGDDKNSKITITSDFVNTNLSCGNSPRVVKFTLTDACGNSTSETAKLSIVDSEAPKFTSVPANITVKCDATNYAFGTPTAIDNCSAVTLTSKDADTGVNCTTGGTKTRVWTASDACGNTATASQTIYFEPKTTVTKPVVFTMTNKVFDKIIACNEQVVFDTPTIESSCSEGIETSSSYVDTQTAGKCGNNVNYIRKWTFKDKCNNQHNINQTLSVIDNIAPTFKANLPTSFKMKKSLFNLWKKLYFQNFVKATDNCSAVTLSAPIYKTLSAKSVECTVVANDQCGNTSKYVCIVIFEEGSKTISSASSKETLREDDNNDIANRILEEVKATVVDETPMEIPMEAVIYPNPFDDVVNLNIELLKTKAITLIISDVLGRVVQSEHLVAQQGLNNFSLNLNALLPATYFLTVSDGQTKRVQKIVKQ